MIGALRPHRQPGQRGAQRFQEPGHDAERGVDQRVQLLIGLIGVGEEPGQHLEQHLVGQVERLGDRLGERVGRLRLRPLDVVRLLDGQRERRAWRGHDRGRGGRAGGERLGGNALSVSGWAAFSRSGILTIAVGNRRPSRPGWR